MLFLYLPILVAAFNEHSTLIFPRCMFLGMNVSLQDHACYFRQTGQLLARTMS